MSAGDGTFTVPVEGGELAGVVSGAGEPVLVLHGGPWTDYTAPLAELLPEGLQAIRYQQRGMPPSTDAPPLDVDAHVRDLVAVLDARGLERAWLLGHSWGGHLALHAAVAHPERVAGVVTIGTLGAVGDGGLSALDANVEAAVRSDPEALAEAEELSRRFEAGESRDVLVNEQNRLVWPYYFADPESAAPQPEGLGTSWALVSAVAESIREHFARRTLERGLPGFPGPVTLIHGELDPLPPEASADTAALVPGATFELMPGVGHYPWLERPAATRDALARAFAREGAPLAAA